MRRSAEIQVLRAVAASLVVADHVLLRIIPGNDAIRALAWTLGDIGVAIFFVISGFIMVATSYKGDRAIAPLEFAKRRILRIVPLYWIFTALVAASLFLHRGQTGLSSSAFWHESLTSFFFIPHEDHFGQIRPVLGVGWTLNYEMLFYLIFTVALFFPKVYGLAFNLLALVALALAGAVTTGAAWGSDFNTPWEFVSFPIILLFGAGMLIAVVTERESPLFHRHLSHSATLFAFIPVVVVAYFVLNGMSYPVSVYWRASMWIACSLYVFLTIAFDHETPKNFYTRAAGLAGDASYSIYLSHTFLMSFSDKHMGFLKNLPQTVSILLLFSLAIAIGIIVHLFLEKPLLHLSRFEFGVRPVKPALEGSSETGAVL